MRKLIESKGKQAELRVDYTRTVRSNDIHSAEGYVGSQRNTRPLPSRSNTPHLPLLDGTPCLLPRGFGIRRVPPAQQPQP